MPHTLMNDPIGSDNFLLEKLPSRIKKSVFLG
jgi:hypothetical protein